MKPNLNFKKLTLNKNTVSNIEVTEMKIIKGGATGYTCNTFVTCYFSMCPVTAC